MDFHNLINVTDKVIKDYQDSLNQLEVLEMRIKQNQDQQATLKDEIALLEDVRVFLQELAEVARYQVKSGLEQVVTLCLQAVFGPDMSFEIEIDTSRNNTVVDFYVVNTDGDEVVRFAPEDTMGGGVVDTCAIGLRYGLLKVLNPEPIGPIILDEPAKMVSANYIDSIAQLMQELRSIFEKQNILVTHHLSIMDVVDNAIHFEKVNGVTKIVSTVAK